MAQVISGTLIDNFGRPISGATITVKKTGGAVLADLFSDDGLTASIGNPLTTEADGSYLAYAANGKYYKEAAKIGYTFDNTDMVGLVLFDPFIVRTVAAADSLTEKDYVVALNAATAGFTFSLPALASVREGQPFVLYKSDITANAIVIDPDGAETINGQTTLSLASAKQGIIITKVGSEWITYQPAASTTAVAGQIPIGRSGDGRLDLSWQDKGVATKADDYTLTESDRRIITTPVSYLNKNTIAFVDGGGGNDSITDSDNGFVTAGFAVSDIIEVQGSDLNDGEYTILSVVAGTIEVATGSLTAEVVEVEKYIDLRQKITITLPTASTVAGSGHSKNFEVTLDGEGFVEFDGTISGEVNKTLRENGATLEFYTDGSVYYKKEPKANLSEEAEGVADDWRHQVVRDFFMGRRTSSIDSPVGDLGWEIVGPNGFSGTTNEYGESGAGASSAASIGAIAATHLGDANSKDPYWGFTVVFRASIAVVTSRQTKIGLMQSIVDGAKTSDPDGIYFHLDTNVDGNWKAVSRKDGTETEVDTGVAAQALGPTTFKIIKRSLWQEGVTDIRYYIDKDLVATITTNVPGGTAPFTDRLRIAVVTEALSAGGRGVRLLYFYFKQILGGKK